MTAVFPCRKILNKIKTQNVGVHVKRRTGVDIISNKETYDSEDDQGTPHKGHRTCK